MKSLLEQITQPSDIKPLSQETLKVLAHEIRIHMIQSLSQTGGHLAPNLGVVELTLALHRCFDSPKDQFVFDVGHQTYVHKMLTGRLKDLHTLRQMDGLSGFPKRSESPHDHFDTGHSSTSISAALGLAVSRDLKKQNHHVIAIIGDGALSGGLAFEGLNNAAQLKENFIVILNDNQMSISKNVGAMSIYLDRVRTAPLYHEVKEDVRSLLKRIPKIGDDLVKTIQDFKDSLKQLVIPGMFFEEMGFTYLGPVDGHSIKQLTQILNQAKKVAGPVLVHVHTIKGKGYAIAERHPERFHGIGPFNVQTGEGKVSQTPSYSAVCGETLTRLAHEHSDIIAITAAMPDGTGLNHFKKAHPERFFDVGIAEAHALTFAAGLAASGHKPFVVLYASFLQRAYDQLVHDIATQNLNVTLCIDRAGIVGEDGETHQGVFDLSFMNHIPNMTIMSPRNTDDLAKCLEFAYTYNQGPLAIRYPRGHDYAFIPHENPTIHYGKWETLETGSDVAILFTGSMYQAAYEAYQTLCMEGLSPSLVHARFIKPMDQTSLLDLCHHHHTLFVVEENLVIGGLGSEIQRFVSQEALLTRVHIKGIEDVFVPQGTRNGWLSKLGLDSKGILTWMKAGLTNGKN